MINFSKIHSFESGQRASFEELVCQLARREIFPANSQFRRVEGAGGDGGVEAYWLQADGKECGYQAKYFLRTGDIDWSQIDDSVSQAITVHEKLERYVIALPCDLTDRTGKKGRGKTGWEHWSVHVQKWQSEAEKLGNKTIQFEPWTQSELIDRLSKPNASGLRQYWFGEVEFSQDWFKEHVKESTTALDERYHPEDHVNVRIQKLFSIITRDKTYISDLSNKLSTIAKCTLPDQKFSGFSRNPDPDLLAELSDAHQQLIGIHDEFSLPPDKGWHIDKWTRYTDELLSLVGKITDWYWDYEQELEEGNSERSRVRVKRQEASALRDAAESFRSLCSSKYMKAERRRLAFVIGAAGTGKSHLFGQEASDSANKGKPVILVLGQRLNDEEPWSQLAKLLQLAGNRADVLLGALDAAGEATGTRTLLLIDAINEGPGSRYWQSHIISIVKKLKIYRNIACVISCRSEYFPIAVPASLSNISPIFEVRGFETAEEQINAAHVFLDRRGIARPSTPWLAPEFINPLFLRSVCTALERDQKSEFPAGITGTRKILGYYLDSIGRNISATEGSLVPLSSKVKASIVAVANEMTTCRKDYLTLSDAGSIFDKHFQSLRPKSETSWLLVFLSNGLVRRDPSPLTVDDPLKDTEDVIRFSFQRFQDFLMGEALVANSNDATKLFGKSGVLSFMLEENQISWPWRGLFEALSSIIPEKFNCELVDILPGGVDNWWNLWEVYEAFIESIKWRERSAFSDRSLKLLNALYGINKHPAEVLLEVSVSADHPWNAELLHRNLSKRRIAERDTFWTVWLNEQSDDVESSVGRLIDWCLSGQAPHTTRENQFLAALTLCWFFTSSNRRIRDKTTKALTSLFIARADLFSALLERFKNVDDLYVLERILAAAFGASCRDQSLDRLNSYSSSIFHNIFADGTPPVGLLLRDYGFGIVELARYHNALSGDVDFDLCCPPYKSKKVHFTVNEQKIKALAHKARGDDILWSTTAFMSDFSRYEAEPRIRRFLSTSLKKPVLLTSEQRLLTFIRDVVGTEKEKIQAFEQLKRKANPYSYGLLKPILDSWEDLDQSEIDEWQKDLKKSEKDFLALLSKDDIRRFKSDAAPSLYDQPTKQPPKIDLAAAMRWVANRAYRFGWTAKRFPRDRSKVGNYSRDRPVVERIGKKYQWLALDELICRLADNNWLSGEYGNLPSPYVNPIDVGFVRDIDPTIIEKKEIRQFASEKTAAWAFKPEIHLREVSESGLPAWPFEEDPASELKDLIVREDDAGLRWIVLYEHQSKTESYAGKRVGEHNTRQQEFRFLMSVVIRKNNISEIFDKLKADQEIDVRSWGTFDITDEAFLFEAPWRDTWPGLQWRYDRAETPEGISVAFPVFGYCWESHLDASLPEGFRTHLPSTWLSNLLGLKPDINLTGSWVSPIGEVIFREISGEEGSVICLIREDALLNVLTDELCVLSLLVSERNAWPGGSNHNASWRRSEGLCWHDGKKLRSEIWKRDNGNGTSERYVKG
jgi:hypothetical protein